MSVVCAPKRLPGSLPKSTRSPWQNWIVDLDRPRHLLTSTSLQVLGTLNILLQPLSSCAGCTAECLVGCFSVVLWRSRSLVKSGFGTRGFVCLCSSSACLTQFEALATRDVPVNVQHAAKRCLKQKSEELFHIELRVSKEWLTSQCRHPNTVEKNTSYETSCFFCFALAKDIF